ncbi:MAG TPA: ABC transporter permease, partial [Gammaproteobacteria bacterium]|nr:ABC transporter permease [Gammaproteobacteria bacterium]
MNGFLKDLNFGLRQLTAKPGFAIAAILTLALGIGANTVVFSFLSGYLLRPLPYPDGERLTQVAVKLPKIGADVEQVQVSLPIYQIIQTKTDVFAATAFYNQRAFNVSVDSRAHRLSS